MTQKLAELASALRAREIARSKMLGSLHAARKFLEPLKLCTVGHADLYRLIDDAIKHEESVS